MVRIEESETAEERAARYERALRAISNSELTGTDFGDWVQAACEDVLQGFEAECPKCLMGVHDWPCVAEEPAAAENEAGAAESTADRGFNINTQ